MLNISVVLLYFSNRRWSDFPKQVKKFCAGLTLKTFSIKLYLTFYVLEDNEHVTEFKYLNILRSFFCREFCQFNTNALNVLVLAYSLSRLDCFSLHTIQWQF